MDCSLFADCLDPITASPLVTSFWASASDSFASLSGMFQSALPIAQSQTGDSNTGISWEQYAAIGVAIAVMVLPFVIGGYLAKTFKMPTYGTRFGCILLAVVASSVVLFNKLPGLGVDLRGGTILVYEIDPSKNRMADGESGQRIVSQDLIEPLTRRINPSGTQEIVIRPYGESQIEIIVPEVDQREVDRIKELVEEAGILRFAIVANQVDHQRIIDLANEQSQSNEQGVRTQDVVYDIDGKDGGSAFGLWANIDREDKTVDGVRPLRVNVGNSIVRNPENGAILNLPTQVRGDGAEVKIAQWMAVENMSRIEVLTIVDPLLDIKGEDLAFAASTFDENGRPAVAFTLTDAGSGRFFALTTNNAPVGTRQRQLGIVLDDNLLSAPSLQQPISKEGRITGNFTREEVESLVQILKAGQLPAALTKQPIAENQIDATLGKDTITKGVYAIGVSLALVLVFILIYYRFAGFVACVALVLNLAMILATMVLINQPLTLPGLAGLVLTVGMSVDANVLIFERIREEIKKGAASRMAVRNGFAKATVTIVDANLTTLITAFVLYAIGTDQIRGFAVTLILGILYSMFTAIYMSRTFFDFAERHGLLSLSMSDGVNSFRSMLTGDGNLDFIGKGKFTLALSALLVCIGIASLVVRGRGILDIDFAGGSSVQFRLDKPTDTELVRKIVQNAQPADTENPIQFTVNGVSMEDIPDGTVYKVDSSYEKVDDLKEMVAKAFQNDSSVGLVTYDVDIRPAGDARVLPRTRARPEDWAPGQTNGVMLTAARAQNDDSAGDDAPADTDVDGDENESAAGPASGQPDSNGSISGLPDLVYSEAIVELGIEGSDGGAMLNGKALLGELEDAAEAAGVPLAIRSIELKPYGEGSEEWKADSSLPFSKWKVKMPLSAVQADKVMEEIKQSLGSDPVWISSSSVGGRVAGDMIGRALGALFASLLCIIGYIWFRFQRVIYGFAAVAALLHDVLITLGAIAVSYWLADALGFLLIDPFKISLTVVAALLTIIGYSLNDTIVVFDRIRETKGKAPKLTGEMVNTSINQTLSRTLLTSVTTLIVVVLLYAFGGEGIHAFAFALVIGVLVGTYSSVFVASPILLWLVGRGEKAKVA